MRVYACMYSMCALRIPMMYVYVISLFLSLLPFLLCVGVLIRLGHYPRHSAPLAGTRTSTKMAVGRCTDRYYRRCYGSLNLPQQHYIFFVLFRCGTGSALPSAHRAILCCMVLCSIHLVLCGESDIYFVVEEEIVDH